MMPLLIQPPRPRAVPLVAPWRPASLGQQAPSVPAINLASDTLQDIPQVVSQNQWASQKWSKDDAIATFNVANLLWSVREKIAFSATLFQRLVADPRTLGVINTTDPDSGFPQATASLISLAQQLSHPNMMSSIRNLLTALEINVLPAFGVGVRGFRPLFNVRTKQLDQVKTDTSLGKSEVIDFGDLYKTSLTNDVKALQVVTQDAAQFAPEIKLGALPALATLAITAGIWVVTILIIGRGAAIPTIEAFAKIFNPITSNPELLKLLEQMRQTDPVAAAKMLNDLSKAGDVWAKGVDIAMWVAIGIGSVALAWIVGSVV